MQTKFKIIETVYYYFAVSDEKVEKNDYVYQVNFEKTNIQVIQCVEDFQVKIANVKDGSYTKLKIIAHLPKNNAPELLYDVKIPSDENVNMQKVSRLPLLPEIVIEDNVEKLAEEFVKDNLKRSSQAAGVMIGFIEGYKAANKFYTEQDMIMAAKYGYEFRDTTSFPEHKFEDSCINNFKQKLQSLNQPRTATHFEAETITPYVDGFTEDKVRRFYGKPELKTELINGKETLVGNYLFE